MVLRVRAGGQVYFVKASPPALRYEAALTQAIAHRHPEQTVELLAVEAERGWLLMCDGGPLLRDHFQSCPDLSLWHSALADYARLQIAERDQIDNYLDMGLPDRKPAQLRDALEQLIAEQRMVPVDLVEEFTDRELERLKARLPDVGEICRQIDQFPVPAAIDHGDFHDGNIFYQDGGFRIFDWGDSGVGHPFMSLRTAFVSVENTFGLDEEDPSFNDLRDAYLTPWRSIAAGADLRKVFDLARRIWAIPGALRWASALRAGPPDEFEKYVFAVPSLLAELLAALEEPGS
jgi:hypothetical protein